MRFVYLECTENNKRRFYRMTAQNGLFGPVLIREWGRIGTLGQCLVHPLDDNVQLETLWQETLTTRMNRGYEVVSSGGEGPPITLFPNLQFYLE